MAVKIKWIELEEYIHQSPQLLLKSPLHILNLF